MDEHKKILYKVCYSYCRNRDDREDLAQEIIVQLWRSFGSFEEHVRFSTWMYRIALNVAISFYRRENTRTRHVLSDEEKVLNAIDETENQSAEVQALYEFIEELEPLNKALILLYLDGNSYSEIADVVGHHGNQRSHQDQPTEADDEERISRSWTSLIDEPNKGATMLDLDQMKQQWAEHDRKLEETIRLNRQLLSTTKLNGARSALQRMAAFLGVGAIIWFAIVVALGSFIYAHIGVLRFALPASLVDLFAIGMLSASIRLMATVRQIDYGRPVTSIQRQLANLRRLRIRITQWALIAGTVVWAPAAIVACRALLGIETYSVAWLLANVVFGLSLIPLSLWASKKFGDRMGQSPFMQQLMNDIAGRNLTNAQAFLSELSEFENEKPI